MSKQLKDLEADLFSDSDQKSSAQVTYDQYVAKLEKKVDRTLLVGNFLESQKQAQVSRLGGQMFDDSLPTKSTFTTFTDRFRTWVLPAAITMMCGTITYPIAVRIARRIFRLRGFYPIHFAIAPFLGLAHINIFGTVQAYEKIKATERDFESLFLAEGSRDLAV
jgi:hypothetical protein